MHLLVDVRKINVKDDESPIREIQNDPSLDFLEWLLQNFFHVQFLVS
jgi:hypothetical protein